MRLVNALNAREHYMVRARRTKQQRNTIWLMLRSAYGSADAVNPKMPLRVTITRIAPRALDRGDNLEASCKAVRDGVADWLGIDDRDPRVSWVCEQVKGGLPREYAVRVDIDEVSA
jgi:hypothetical protein